MVPTDTLRDCGPPKAKPEAVGQGESRPGEGTRAGKGYSTWQGACVADS